MLSPKKWSIRWREVYEMAVLDGFGRLSPKNGAILRRRVYLDDLGGCTLDVSGGWVEDRWEGRSFFGGVSFCGKGRIF